MTKVQIKNDRIAPFGGIFHIMDVFEKCGLKECIRHHLGVRGSLSSAYQYDELFLSFFSHYLCGGDCLEDIIKIRGLLSDRPNTRITSPDTIARGLKELRSPHRSYVNKKGKTYNFNLANRLNRLLVHMLSQTGQLKRGDEVDVDFDHEFTPGEKYDAKFFYQKKKGYFPGVATVGGLIVGIENRDANTNVKFKQADTHCRILSRLICIAGVRINRFRADCDSYSREITEEVSKYCKTFYIRANNCRNRYQEFAEIKDWKKVEINNETYEVTSLVNDPLVREMTFRLVVQRQELKDGEGNPLDDLFGCRYMYRCIITNDWNMSDEEVIRYYNQRGESEKNFDIQNNDFGWAHLPFSDMGENTSFLLVTAMLKNFYLFLLQGLVPHIKEIEMTSRLKTFMFHFIHVPAKWIRAGRKYVLNLYTRKTYYQNIFLE